MFGGVAITSKEMRGIGWLGPGRAEKFVANTVSVLFEFALAGLNLCKKSPE